MAVSSHWWWRSTVLAAPRPYMVVCPSRSKDRSEDLPLSCVPSPHRPIVWRHFIYQRFLFSDDSSLCHVDKKLTNTDTDSTRMYIFPQWTPYSAGTMLRALVLPQVWPKDEVLGWGLLPLFGREGYFYCSGSQLCRLDTAPREGHTSLALLLSVKISWLTTVAVERVLWPGTG